MAASQTEKADAAPCSGQNFCLLEQGTDAVVEGFLVSGEGIERAEVHERVEPDLAGGEAVFPGCIHGNFAVLQRGLNIGGGPPRQEVAEPGFLEVCLEIVGLEGIRIFAKQVFDSVLELLRNSPECF